MSIAPSAAPWLIPDWPAPGHVRALFTTRGASEHDGASRGPYGFFNLGDHVGDDPVAVAANRAHLTRALGGAQPGFLNQVHGTVVRDGCSPGNEPSAAGPAPAPTADAAVSNHPGRACTVMVADCLPVLFTNRAGTVVGAVHAGWRGLAIDWLGRQFPVI